MRYINLHLHFTLIHLHSHFQGQKVKGQIAGGGAYCGGLPHILFLSHARRARIHFGIFDSAMLDDITDWCAVSTTFSLVHARSSRLQVSRALDTNGG